MLPIFKNSASKNYSIEVLYMLHQYHYVLPERQAQELIWNRFVNIHGLPGKNIPADLHQEHLNRMCKIALQGLCANKTEKAITRIGKAQGTLSLVLDKFDEENCTSLASSGVHKKLTAEKDRDTIIKQLQQAHVFDYCNSHRKHSNFPKPKNNFTYYE